MQQLLDYLQTFTPAQRIAALALITGGLMNGIKRMPQLPSRWVPLASIALAFVLSAAYYLALNFKVEGALQFALEALIAGGLPAGGHKFFKAVWVPLFGEESADKWLGQADASLQKAQSMSKPTIVLCLLLSLAQTGCAAAMAVLEGLAQAGQASQLLGSSIDYAEQGADRYFNRHPPMDQNIKHQVEQKILEARLARKTLDAIALSAKDAKDGKLVEAQDHAADAYESMFDLLAALGILGAIPPEGGAENEAAPLPEPLDLASPSAMRSSLMQSGP